MSDASAQQPSAMAGIRTIWERGLADEIQFWESWIGSRGLDWPADYQRRVDPDTPFQQHLRSLIDVPHWMTIRVLDVGAGPMTRLGKRWENRRIEIAAVDPLAEEYMAILERVGVKPLIQTRRCEAERLTSLFPEGLFDLSYAINSLDHSYDAVGAIRQMLLVTRPGAFVHLDHAVNEAEQEGYQGLHQWNFCVEGNRFIVWRPGVRADVARALEDLIGEARIDASDTWLAVSLRRR